MPTIDRVGNVGLYVQDVDVMMRFYKEVLGLHITDIDEKAGRYFSGSRPDEEHHELLLCAGRTAAADALLLQQVAFKCPSLDDVIEFYGCQVEGVAKIEYTVTHGNAIAVYFYDPDGNRGEVYWDTGLKARQGGLLELDLNDESETIK
jgi:catechol-2,3-dioxygenase